jgi:shikimate kinase
MRIFLVGYMGSGKSTVAKKLAARLGLSAIDLDGEIERSAGQPVSRLFETLGEDAFRRLEQETLQHWLLQDDFVMATGGGTPCFFDSMQRMNHCGTTVFLQMPPKALAERVSASKTERPLLKGLAKDGLIAHIAEHLGERKPFYDQSKLVVNGLDVDLDGLVALLGHSK